MNTFIVVADVHISAKLFNLPAFEQDIRDEFVKAVDLAIEKKVKYFIVAGDLYEHNHPAPDAVAFVTRQVDRLRANEIIPLAIAGDHDKPVEGKNWAQHTNGFDSPSMYPCFIGINYSDVPAQVMEDLQDQLRKKPDVEWAFLHGQVPELFAFCEEKKTLPLKQLDYSVNCAHFNGFLLGDIHKPIHGTFLDPACNKKLHAEYCGSLGVTKSDEFIKEGILYYDGKTLSRIKLPVDREYFRFELNEELIENAQSIHENLKNMVPNKKRPVFIVDYTKDFRESLVTFKFLYDFGIVKFVYKTGVDDGSNKKSSIRSELNSTDKIQTALKLALEDKESYDLGYSLLTSDLQPKETLDAFKEKMFSA